MPRGWFDFGNIDSLLSGKQIDNTELLYSLNQIGFIDGLGKTLLYTNFSNGFDGWRPEVSSELSTVTYNIEGLNIEDDYQNKGRTIVLHPSIKIGEYAGIYQYIMTSNQQKIGVEIGYYFRGVPTNTQIYIDYRVNEDIEYLASLYIDYALGVIQLMTPGMLTTLFSFTPVSFYSHNYQQLKIVCNYADGKYHRLYFADNVYDLSMYDLYPIGGSGIGKLSTYIYSVRQNAQDQVMFLKYVRISKDEP